MAKVKGIDILVKVRTATGPDVYMTVAGQRDATLNLATDEIDASTKDGSGWKESLVGLKGWSIDFDALHSDSDTGLQKLFDEYISGNQVVVRIIVPNPGKTYQGTATITSLSLGAPHDDVAAVSGSLSGTGALTQTAT